MAPCSWALGSPLMRAYHDLEWGVPTHDDRALFELLTLEGAQAGLSWSTILNRREGYRRAFEQFDLQRVANFSDADLERLLADTQVIRNRGKLASTIKNAQHILEIQGELGTFDTFIWSFVGFRPVVNLFTLGSALPAQTQTSVELSQALRKRGFGFVGPTICYAFMQSAGLVNDHVVTCPRHAELSG